MFSLFFFPPLRNVYLMLAVGVGDARHMRVSKQEVKCDGEEGQVFHEGEVLPVQNHVAQPV